MAFNDTLFQLGMDLTRSSTAQKEDLHGVVRLAHEDCKKSVADHESTRAAQRIIVDVFGARRTESAKSVERALKQALEFAKGKVVRCTLNRDRSSGCISGTVALTDGHASVEAWPSGAIAVDLVSVGGMRPELVLTALTDTFDAREVVLRRQRSESDLAKLRAAALRASRAQAQRPTVARMARAKKAA